MTPHKCWPLIHYGAPLVVHSCGSLDLITYKTGRRCLVPDRRNAETQTSSLNVSVRFQMGHLTLVKTNVRDTRFALLLNHHLKVIFFSSFCSAPQLFTKYFRLELNAKGNQSLPLFPAHKILGFSSFF